VAKKRHATREEIEALATDCQAALDHLNHLGFREHVNTIRALLFTQGESYEWSRKTNQKLNSQLSRHIEALKKQLRDAGIVPVGPPEH